MEDSKPILMSKPRIGTEGSLEVAPSISSVSFDFDYCLNCYQKLNNDYNTPKPNNAQKKRNHNEEAKPKDNGILLRSIVDKSNGTTLLDILDLFFNIKHEAELQNLCFDAHNVSLCSLCSNMVEEMYTIFMDVCKNSKAPSFMSSFLQKYQLNKIIKLVKSDPEVADDYSDDKESSEPENESDINQSFDEAFDSDTDNELDLLEEHKKPLIDNQQPESIGIESENRLEDPSRHYQTRSSHSSKIKNYKNQLDNAVSKLKKSYLHRATSKNKNLNLGKKIEKVKFKTSGKKVLKSKRPVACEKCCARFLKRSHYLDHTKCHTADEFKSTFCKGTFNSERNLKKHISLYHSKKKHSKSKPILERQYVCSECDFPFMSKSHLKSHLANIHQITNEVLSFPCPVCLKKFPTQKSLDEHLNKIHTPRVIIKKNECDECGRCFLKKCDLTNHMTTHTNIRLFICEVCGFKSKRPQDLSRHRKLVHLKEVNYACDTCNKGFLSLWQLKAHQLTHTKEKLFLCLEPNCGKSFRCPTNLRQHMYVHKGIKHVCHFCGESYSRTTYLQRHIKMVHTNIAEPEKHNNENNKHFCHFCGESYSRTTYLQRHIKIAHANIEIADAIHLNPEFKFN